MEVARKLGKHLQVTLQKSSKASPLLVFVGGIALGLVLSALFLQPACDCSLAGGADDASESLAEDSSQTGNPDVDAPAGSSAAAFPPYDPEQEGHCPASAFIPNEKVSPESPWFSMKAILRPSPCKISGFTIEELDPRTNFRRLYTLGFTEDKESKIAVLPYLRAAQDLAMHRRGRRVYIDLGGKFFASSVEWFLRYYPMDFTEIHVFEARLKVFHMRPQWQAVRKRGRVLFKRMTYDSRLREHKRGPGPIAAHELRKVKIYEKFVENEENQEEKKVDLTKFILEDLGLTSNDTLVVKMDIEGSEWPILRGWLSRPEIATIVDELFVEIHYSHPTMKKFLWNWPYSRNEAVELLAQLRSMGLYVHAWP